MPEFTADRSDAIEHALVRHVETHPHRRSRWARAVGLVLVGAVVGTGASVGAGANGLLPLAIQQPAADPADAIEAPPGVMPGAPVIAALGEPESVTMADPVPVEYPLGDRPEEATHARVTVVPTSAGTLLFGTDPGGNNPGASWRESEIRPESSAYFDFPLDGWTTTLFLTPTSFTGIVTIQYLTYVPTRFGVNEYGQTYGSSDSPLGQPDLTSVIATNGREGFVVATDWNEAMGVTDLPSSPEEAVRRQEERAGTSVALPVYESDGRTVIGEFIMEY